jgi:hypothetical protein
MEHNIMIGKKKNKSPINKRSAKKPKVGELYDIDEALKRIKVIYSVNGKYKSQLVERKEGGWICQIWSIDAGGRQRPMLRNVQPFSTLEEAIEMAQQCFARLTGDDRYFAKEDIMEGQKPD